MTSRLAVLGGAAGRSAGSRRMWWQRTICGQLCATGLQTQSMLHVATLPHHRHPKHTLEACIPLTPVTLRHTTPLPPGIDFRGLCICSTQAKKSVLEC